LKVVHGSAHQKTVVIVAITTRPSRLAWFNVVINCGWLKLEATFTWAGKYKVTNWGLKPGNVCQSSLCPGYEIMKYRGLLISQCFACRAVAWWNSHKDVANRYSRPHSILTKHLSFINKNIIVCCGGGGGRFFLFGLGAAKISVFHTY
jgi:hypothetical protein